MPRKALVVVDMLGDFLLPQGGLFIGLDAAKVTSAVAEEIAAAHEADVPVIYVNDSHALRDSEFRMFPPHCVISTPGAEVVDALKPEPGDHVITKRRFSAFFQTDLDLTLGELDVEQVRLVGVCTNIGILYTAADARMLNYDVVVPRSAVASFDRGASDFALQQMSTVLGCEVVD